MKTAKIYQDQLLAGLNTVNRAIGTHGILAILSNVLMTFSEKDLTLFATNLEIGIETIVPAEKCEPFKTTVPAKLFYDLIATMPGQLITLEYDDLTDNIKVNGTKSHHNIKCISAVDYPESKRPDSLEVFSIDSTVFKQTISRVLFAASEEENKPVLSSAVFSIEEDQLVIYATDGFRASLRTIPMKGLHAYERKIIIPSMAVSEAAKIASEESAVFSLTNSTVVIKCGRNTIFSQLIDGKAPDHKLIDTLIQSIQTTTVRVNTGELSMLCKQADLFASKDDKKYILISADLTGLSITASAQQVGDSEGHVNATVEGSPLKISLSSAYVREFIDAAKTPTITIKMKDARSPSVFYVDDLLGYWHMIMPVAL
jgi:DNA polymerase III subunit beta